MKQIHGKLNIDVVDQTMYVETCHLIILLQILISMCREELREQHALGEEIANAITNAPLGETIDESELDDELAELEQEQLDNKMIDTGTVPVHKLPDAVNGERKSSSGLLFLSLSMDMLTGV